MTVSRRQCDILIVGTGIAGLYTALKCSGRYRVTVLTKKRLEDSSTEFAQGGIAAAIAPGDSPTLHLEDTLLAGDGLCDPDAARVLVEEGPGCVKELAAWGVRFDMAGEDFELTREGAHSRRRIVHARGDATGDEIRRGLAARVSSSPAITVREDEYALDLLMHKGRCVGVVSLGPSGEKVHHLARAVVIATGGAGQLYRHSTNPDVATGDGIAMAFRAGAEVADMEFIQFHPTALFATGARAGDSRSRVLISEAVRGEGALLLNTRGERFMQRYHPMGELAPRDVVARAIAREMELTDMPFVLLDARPIGANFPSRFPTIYERCLQHGFNPVNEPIPVSPAAHYTMGGIRTDLNGATNIPGLLACGEAACTGVHGANRLASNSLLEGLVFGKRIANVLGEAPGGNPFNPDVSGNPLPVEPKHLEGALPTGGVPDIWHRVQNLMWSNVGLYRDERRLLEAQQELESIYGLLSRIATSRETAELLNLVTVAKLVVRAALERKESRGAHFRSDYPVRDDHRWQQRIVIKGTELRYVPVTKADKTIRKGV